MDTRPVYYLKIEGIRGDVTTKPYDGWIEIEWFDLVDWSNHNSGGRGTGVGTPKQNVLSTGMYFNSGSQIINQSYASGKHFHEAIVVARKGNAEYLRVTMTDVMITLFRREYPTVQNQRPIDRVQIHFKSYIINHGSTISSEPVGKPISSR